MAGAFDDRGSPAQRKKPDLDPLLVRKDICGSLMKRFAYVLLLSKRRHATEDREARHSSHPTALAADDAAAQRKTPPNRK